MASVPTITYLSLADLQAQTLIDELKSLNDGDKTTLIQIAEDQIDKYVGKQKHHPWDTNITRVFPRVEDYQRTNLAEYPEIPEIPYDVSRACLRQVEWLFTQWWTNEDATDLPTEYDVESAEIGGEGSVSEKYVRNGLGLTEASLAPQARLLLSEYRSRGAQIATSRVRRNLGPGVLSSREGYYFPNP
jgi:hypothetical protein